MKHKMVLIAIGGSLLLAAPALRAGDSAPNASHHPKGPRPEGARLEHLLPAPLVEKLNLTEDQKTKFKAIDESYGKSAREYMDAHKAEADAARAEMKAARESNDDAKMKEARQKMRTVMEGLKPQRDAAMDQVKSILNDEQKKTLEDAKAKVKEHRAGGGHGKDAAPAAK